MKLSGSANPKAEEDSSPLPRTTSFSLWRRLFLALVIELVVLVSMVAIWQRLVAPPAVLVPLMLGLGLFLSLGLSLWAVEPIRHGLEVLRIGLSNYRAGDYSIRLAAPEQAELAELTRFFNHMADLARDEHGIIYQKELLLDTLVQSTPMGILLVGPNGRLILANRDAKEMFGLDRPLTDMKLDELLNQAPLPLRHALDQSRDALFTLTEKEEVETFHLSQRRFRLNTLPHRLIMIKRMTRALRRQEVETWKKMIRLINHELNNTLAPLRSLQHSARTILKQPPEQHHKLERIFETMERVIDDLRLFLEDYAAFARMPMPRKETVQWGSFLTALHTLIPFTLDNRLTHGSGFFDPGQVRQMLLNLLKNAREASPEDSGIGLVLSNTVEGDTLIQVKDRGKGMRDEALEKALLPFFSTKKTGTGLGLPLCREIIESHGGTIRLQSREGGGMTVTCRLPDTEPH